jgi:tRNA(adenine34) deaminase
MFSPYGQDKDQFFMAQALKQARLALKYNEVPVGAVIVSPEGEIIGRGYNQTEKRSSQAFHAEMLAVASAGRHIGDWRLCDCWIYVTLEPCSMCMSLIRLSRCAGLVYGAASPLFGYQVVDKDGSFSVYKENVVESVAGLYAEESAALLKGFFRARRIKKKEESREKECCKCSGSR